MPAIIEKSELDSTDAPVLEALERLISRFDFASCQRHMMLSNWRWARSDNSRLLYLPSVEDMKKAVRDLAESVITESWWFPGKAAASHPEVTSCGGFTVGLTDGAWSIRFGPNQREPVAELGHYPPN